MAKQSVPLSLKLIGRVMRSLIKEFGNRQIETIDGIRVFPGDNWILMHPSSEEPVINLYAEASSKEVTNRLSKSVLKKFIP
jgi:phosphomannomutase